MPGGEEKEQKIGNLSEKIVKESFPNLVKETDMQVQEVQGLPSTMDAKRPIPRYIIIKRTKVKDKERLLKAAREVSCQMGGGRGKMGEEARGLRSTNTYVQNSHGDVKYSIGNGEAKKLIRMTHGQEQWWGDCL